MDNRKIGICIPSFNRMNMVIDATSKVIDDDRVERITIVDDASTDGSYEKLCEYFKDNDKVFIFQNETNLDCFWNKLMAITHSKSTWNILLDSDNVIDKSYIDKLFEIQIWEDKTSYMPSFAKPNFNYTEFNNVVLDKENIAQCIDKPMLTTCLNCMNFFVNKYEYMLTWNNDINPHTADSIWFNYLWFKRGNKMKIVEGLHYVHLVHVDSHYKNNVHKSGNLNAEIIEKMKKLR